MEAEQSKHNDGVSLPEDIVFAVLARLPAKPLCRFRCVCKGWSDLISDSALVAAQRSHAGPHLVGVFIGDCWPPEVRVIDMDGNVVRIFGVQQQATTWLDLIVQTSVNATIIDPAAGRACTVGTDTPTPYGARLSFGHAAPSGAFKVMCLQLEETLPAQICKVATIVDGGAKPLTWRQTSPPPFVTSRLHKRKATVNGVVYCLPPPFNKYGAVSSGSHHIAAFDFESEEWRMINGPALGSKRRHCSLD